ncbi:MAG: undecaprenyl/decaprenyl-phosphate alpha-N-acetylglucosaminyl 1-phosphate transferase [Candidatus Brocadiales bacterium]|nr:undecaprenyl/decaprenyl-phosphate alpha-N-acetylglucosaminyl 1-phosphate transferase [Candidatus Brocadiales bacterium]
MEPFDLIKEPTAQIIISILLALILSYTIGPLAMSLSKKLGAMDIPGSAAHKKHNAPMPLAGGLVILIALPIMIVLSGLWKDSSFLSILAGGSVIFLFGIVDDIYGLSAFPKFTGQFIAAAILAYSGIIIRFLENANISFETPVVTALNWGLTLFWVVGITNAFNLIDSMDGLVAGLTIIIAGFFTFVTFVSGQMTLSLLSAILIGISVGLYYYNKHPARFFLGDSGSQVIGFLLAAIAINYRPPDLNPGSTWFVPILLLGIPIFDTSLVVISRLRRRKPLFQADRSHTYHRLVNLGFTSPQAVIAIHAAAFLLSLLALLAMFLPPNVAILLFFIVLLVGSLLIVFFEISTSIEQ